MAVVYIGLGSNLENPLAQITQAVTELAHIPANRLLARSANYASRAIGPGDQPDYINAVAKLETSLMPLELLDSLQAIEHAHRRIRFERWGPRTLDLDILLIDDQVFASERLTVPHPYLNQRNFVLYPLAEIVPDLILPSGIALKTLLAQCSRDGLEQLPN